MQKLQTTLKTAVKVKVDYRSPTSINAIRLPGLLTSQGMLISLLQYLSEKRRSNSWRTKVTFSVSMLLDYISLSGIPFDSPTELLKSFRSALANGTIDLDLKDPTGLYWPSRTNQQADDIITFLTGYTDWLLNQPGHSGMIMNPIREANSHEQRLNWCAYHHRQDSRLLSHLTSDEERERNRVRREVSREKGEPLLLEEVKRFPREHFNTLLDEGFIVASLSSLDKHLRTDYKSQAMTLLMNAGGVRKSELFHIYLDDIDVDTERGEAVVRIHHPAVGLSPEPGYKNRKDYLLRKFQIKPRTDYAKSECLHAGWKAPTTNRRKFFRVEFFPPAKAQEFLLAFQNYLLYQRVDAGGRHPYAFTNSKGRPETIKNFQRLHTAAVMRIGLRCRKYDGTTEHAHRHAYGYRLAEAGFSQIDIQRSMHHAHPDSCLVYLHMTDEEIREKMRTKVERQSKQKTPTEATETTETTETKKTTEAADEYPNGRPLSSYRNLLSQRRK